MNLEDLQQLVSQGESERLEFKKTTAEMRGGMETLCGFLNGSGGSVLFGVTPAGKINGQDVTDRTFTVAPPTLYGTHCERSIIHRIKRSVGTDVCNSPREATDYYLGSKRDSFLHAAREGALKSGGENGAVPASTIWQELATGQSHDEERLEFPAFLHDDAKCCETVQKEIMTPTGVEPVSRQ